MGLLIGGRPSGAFVPSPLVMGYSPPSGKYFFASFAFAGPVERNHCRACSGVNSCGSAPGSIGVSKIQFPELVCQKHLMEISRNDFFLVLPPFDKS